MDNVSETIFKNIYIPRQEPGDVLEENSDHEDYDVPKNLTPMANHRLRLISNSLSSILDDYHTPQNKQNGL